MTRFVPFEDYKLARDALLYWKYECSGAEPSLSVFNRMVDDALQQRHPDPPLFLTFDIGCSKTCAVYPACMCGESAGVRKALPEPQK